MKKIKNFLKWYMEQQTKYYLQCMKYGVNPFI